MTKLIKKLMTFMLETIIFLFNKISRSLTEMIETEKFQNRLNELVEPQKQRLKLISNIENNFDYDYVKDDIISIHNKIKDDDEYSMPIGTYLKIKIEEIKIEKSRYLINLITLETYIQKEKNISKNKISFPPVFRVENLPKKSEEKLKHKGSIRVYFSDRDLRV